VIHVTHLLCIGDLPARESHCLESPLAHELRLSIRPSPGRRRGARSRPFGEVGFGSGWPVLRSWAASILPAHDGSITGQNDKRKVKPLI